MSQNKEEFPIRRLEGAPSDNIGWHFGTPILGNQSYITNKLCEKVMVVLLD